MGRWGCGQQARHQDAPAWICPCKPLSDSSQVTGQGPWVPLLTQHPVYPRRTRWQRSRWTWSTSLSMDTSGIHFQTQKCMQNTSWEWTGVPDQWKRTYRTTQNSVGWRNWEVNRSVSGTGPALGGWGNWSRGLIPTAGQLSKSKEKHLRLRVKQLICGSVNEMRIRQSLPQPCIPWTGTQVP